MNLIIDNNLNTDDYLDLIKMVGWKQLTKEQVDKALAHTMYLVRATIDGKTIGMARLVGDFGAHGLLTDVVVNPNFQGQGIGSTLVSNIVDYIRSYLNDNEKFIIELCPSYGKRDFYKRLGFKYKPENMDGMYLWIEK